MTELHQFHELDVPYYMDRQTEKWILSSEKSSYKVHQIAVGKPISDSLSAVSIRNNAKPVGRYMLLLDAASTVALFIATAILPALLFGIRT